MWFVFLLVYMKQNSCLLSYPQFYLYFICMSDIFSVFLRISTFCALVFELVYDLLLYLYF